MADTTATAMSRTDQFLDVFAQEAATTLKVLRAYPPDQAELRPHPTSKSARELAWLFVMEQGMATAALRDQLNLPDANSQPPPPPATMSEIVTAFEQGARRLESLVRGMSDADLSKTVRFYVAPRQLGDIPKMAFLWFLLHDQIHHRGQLSVYLRMTGSKVPSIYGPSGDEPWF